MVTWPALSDQQVLLQRKCRLVIANIGAGDEGREGGEPKRRVATHRAERAQHGCRVRGAVPDGAGAAIDR